MLGGEGAEMLIFSPGLHFLSPESPRPHKPCRVPGRAGILQPLLLSSPAPNKAWGSFSSDSLQDLACLICDKFHSAGLLPARSSGLPFLEEKKPSCICWTVSQMHAGNYFQLHRYW